MERTIRRRSSRTHRINLRRRPSRPRKTNRTRISARRRLELLRARDRSCAPGAVFDLSLRQRRAAGEFAERGVSDVLQILDADFAGVEAVAGEPAKEREKGYALA